MPVSVLSLRLALAPASKRRVTFRNLKGPLAPELTFEAMRAMGL
jgi:hypothetical protein